MHALFYLWYSQEKAKKEAEKRVKNFQKIQKKQDKVLVFNSICYWILLFGVGILKKGLVNSLTIQSPQKLQLLTDFWVIKVTSERAYHDHSRDKG